MAVSHTVNEETSLFVLYKCHLHCLPCACVCVSVYENKDYPATETAFVARARPRGGNATKMKTKKDGRQNVHLITTMAAYVWRLYTIYPVCAVLRPWQPGESDRKEAFFSFFFFSFFLSSFLCLSRRISVDVSRARA